MPRRNINFSNNTFYHVFNKSKTEQTIFKSQKDYNRFYLIILKYQEEFKKYELFIKAWCIMPNHFHFLLFLGDPGVEDIQRIIPNFMMKIQASYGKYFSIKYSTPGSIRKDRYKAKPITDDSYMWTIVNYIQKNSEKHLNIPYKQWKRRSDINVDQSYEKMMIELDGFE